MKRRKFLLGAGIGAGVLATGTAVWLSTSGRNGALTVAAVTQRLSSLRDATVSSTSAWSISKIFNHLAQSVEYSMSGYPSSKSAAFQNWIGEPVFQVFSWKGSMHHNLSEPIPGAPEIAADGNVEAARARLLLALQTFDAYPGPLKPHFAYGTLNKLQYEAAHAMHINEHLGQIIVKA